jgi:heme exporter protein B
MIAVFRHFLRRLSRDRGLLAQAGAFFALALMVCVFSIGSEDVLLLATLPGLSWSALLLASLLGLPDLLPDDELDDLILARIPLPNIMAAKLFAHFAATSLPIALAAPVFLSMALPHADLPMTALWLGFALSGATFSSVGLLGSALTLHSRRNAALQALIVMPLCIPPLIFGSGAVSAAQLDLGWQAPMAFLGAIAAAALTLSPFAAAKIIRMKVTSS